MSYKRHAILEMQAKIPDGFDSNKKMKVKVVEGEYRYILLKLKVLGVLDDNAEFIQYFLTEEEAIKNSPKGTEIIRFDSYKNKKFL